MAKPPPDRPPHAPTARGRAAAQALIDVHTELRRELAQVRQLVADVVDGSKPVGTARGELQRMSMRQHTWTTGAYCAAHCLAVAQHHYGEDHEIFPVLRRRDASLTPVLDRLADEHRAIHDLLERIDTALLALVADASSVTTNLTAVLDQFSDTLLAHLSYEEDNLVGPMADAFG